jgi:hypothetical protein
MAVGTAAPCHCAHASFDHALIRCGCTNDRAHKHHDDPMKNADDAFHRVWCCTCGTYCSKDAHCPLPLPELQASSGTAAMQKKLPRPFLVRLPLQILSLPMCTCSSYSFFTFSSFRPSSFSSDPRRFSTSSLYCFAQPCFKARAQMWLCHLLSFRSVVFLALLAWKPHHQSEARPCILEPGEGGCERTLNAANPNVQCNINPMPFKNLRAGRRSNLRRSLGHKITYAGPSRPAPCLALRIPKPLNVGTSFVIPLCTFPPFPTLIRQKIDTSSPLRSLSLFPSPSLMYSTSLSSGSSFTYRYPHNI